MTHLIENVGEVKGSYCMELSFLQLLVGLCGQMLGATLYLVLSMAELRGPSWGTTMDSLKQKKYCQTN